MNAGEKNVDISVVIVNWNVRSMLKQCLDSLYRFTSDISFEVFVVDNGSLDGSAEMVAKEFPWAILIANSRNLGFSAGNNQALRQARGRYSILLNPDTELVDNSLKAMADFMDGHPQVDCIAPRLIFADGSLQESCRHFPSFFTDLSESLYLDEAFPGNRIFNWYRIGVYSFDRMGPVDQPYGACLLFRKEDLVRLDFMDERFFMYYDEIDLCYRLKKSGGVIYYLPQIRVIHHGNQSSKQVPDACHSWKLRSRLAFFNKHYGRQAMVVLFFNLALRSFVVYGLLGFSHILIRRPRDWGYFKRMVSYMWREYRNSLKGA
ncbi:MAG: glycosyltransferase family 2 protein [Candidatus Omnitrophica bacterium]|nr:glycosyltransferase family 2 protein [Candidatus Omnitrophota bacterium]